MVTESASLVDLNVAIIAGRLRASSAACSRRRPTYIPVSVSINDGGGGFRPALNDGASGIFQKNDLINTAISSAIRMRFVTRISATMTSSPDSLPSMALIVLSILSAASLASASGAPAGAGARYREVALSRFVPLGCRKMTRSIRRSAAR